MSFGNLNPGRHPALPRAGFPSSVEEAILTFAPLGIFGLKTKNNAVDAAKDIDIDPGWCIDTTGIKFLRLSSSLTKRLDAGFARGSGNGGLDGTESVAGTPDANTLYYKWLIGGGGGGLVDVLFSESSSAPIMPSGFSQKALIGALRTDSAANILPYYQIRDDFFYRTSQFILTAGTATVETAVTYTGFVPSVALDYILDFAVFFSHNNVVDAQNLGQIRIFSGQYFLQIGEYQTGNTGNGFDRVHVRVPNTGNLYYFNAPANQTSYSMYLRVVGFKLPRGGIQ